VNATTKYASRSWVAVLPYIGWALVASMVGAGVPVARGFFLFLAGVCSVMVYYGRTLNRLGQAHALEVPLRRASLLMAAITVLAAGALALTGNVGSAVLAAVVGVLLASLFWPWAWQLRVRYNESVRPYRSDYFVLLLVTGAGASALTVFQVWDLIDFSFPSRPSDFSSIAFSIALAASAFLAAWDERRRPRPMWPPMHPVQRPSG